MKWLKTLLVVSLVFSLGACSREKGRDLSILDEEPVEIAKKDLNKHHYTLDVTLDTEKQTLGGEMNVEVKNNSQDDWQELYLRDYASIITPESKPTQYKQVDDGTSDLEVTVDPEDASIVRIDLKTPLKAGTSMKLHINYESYLVLDAYGRFNYTSYVQDDKTIGHYTLGNFYPVLSYYEDGKWLNHPYYDAGECFYTPVSDYDVSVTTPKDYTVSATGVLQEEDYFDESVKRVYHEENVRDFGMSAANDYQVLTDEIDGITIKSYFSEGTEEAGQIALDEAKNAMQLFNRYLGKYPYQEFDVASVASLPGSGMEFPGYVMIAERYYSKERMSSMSNIVVHELAHQWFYGIVGNDQYDMPWLDESLASVMQLIYQDYFYPHEYESSVSRFEQKEDSAGEMDMIVSKSYGEYADPAIFINAAYSVGQMFMYEVREEMGETDFISAIKEYVNTYGYLEAKTENLIEMLNKWSDHSLLALYQIYLEEQYYQ